MNDTVTQGSLSEISVQISESEVGQQTEGWTCWIVVVYVEPNGALQQPTRSLDFDDARLLSTVSSPQRHTSFIHVVES